MPSLPIIIFANPASLILSLTTASFSRSFRLEPPAPFTLCDLDELDLRKNNDYCPSDRSALATFYTETLGTEWLNNENWLSPEHHCDWSGITCSEDRTKVLKLELVSNGVAGRIPEALFNITTLTHLDLNDNDLRGPIPSTIANAKDLQYLRLSYNRLTSLPDEIATLTKLALVHLHSNRMEGDGSVINLVRKADVPGDLELPYYRFISDCGDPQDVSDPFVSS